MSEMKRRGFNGCCAGSYFYDLGRAHAKARSKTLEEFAERIVSIKKLLEEQAKGAGAPLSRRDATAERINRLLRRHPEESLNAISKLYFGVELPNHNRNWSRSSEIARAIRYRLDKNDKSRK